MSTLAIKKATRSAVKIKIFLAGPSGSGKTDGALALAKAFAGADARICVIDTERESASYYADRYEFDTLALDAPYTTDRYVEALGIAVAAGYDVVIIDSITHQWSGVGGILERKEQLDSRPNSNSFTNWAKFTPETERFRNALLEAPVHLIACCRAKQEYVLGDGDGGRGKKVQKMGLKPEQRDGLEYEFGVALQLQMDHKAEATKDRTGVFEGKIADLKNPNVGRALRAWLDAGGTFAPEPARAVAAAAPTPAAAALERDIVRATMPEEGGRDHTESIEEALERAKRVSLMGAPTSWENHGGKPLGECPDKVLRAAKRFFTDKLKAGANQRLEEQLEYIGLVLADRAANSPQESLGLEGGRSTSTPAPVPPSVPVPASAGKTAERALAAHGGGLPERAWAPGNDLPAALTDQDDDLPF
jgi:hypothetical protein